MIGNRTLTTAHQYYLPAGSAAPVPRSPLAAEARAPLAPNPLAQRPALILAPRAGTLAQGALTVPLATSRAPLPQQPVQPLGLAALQRIERPQMVGVWTSPPPFRQPILHQT